MSDTLHHDGAHTGASRRRALATRWLGAGLASCLAVATLWLAVTGRLALYISPSSNWFAITMAVLLLAGALASFLLPLGAEDDAHADHDHSPASRHPDDHRGMSPGGIAAVAGAAVATVVVVAILAVPPASLSAQIAAERDVGAAPLFGGAELVTLATQGDTSGFGVGDWASVFATAPNPDAFEGDAVELTGFVTPVGDGAFDLTRLVITHCVIDAQVARVRVATQGSTPAEGEWVTVTGTVRSAPDGTLQIAAADVEPIDEPSDPYEY
ncbi:MAG: TIGR03943 family protein [Microbacterium sp.]